MKHLIIGTAGHIDHGKTSLIRMLTGIECDTHKEEKARGITINLGFAHIQLPSGETAGIIDVPGHKDFINTMVGGACGIDLVLLVIACDSGIMPQTVEHINIITALGINKGVVALTKTDLVDEEMVELAQFEITDYLKHTSLRNAPVVGVSAHTGSGKEDLVKALESEIAKIERSENNELFRMYIDRIFSVKGFGSVVTGSVLGGMVSVGKDVYLLPGSKQKLRIRSIERHGESVDSVEKGDRAAINIIGLKHEDFERGMLICDKQSDQTEMIDAYINLFDNVPSLPVWSNITFISGTYEVSARMHLLNKDVIDGGKDGIVQIHLNKPTILLNRDRFIIRNSSADLTLGGGYIIDSQPLHHRKRTPQLIEELENLSVNIISGNSTGESIGMILKREFRPFTIDEIADKLNISREVIRIEMTDNHGSFLMYEVNGNEIFIADQCESSFIKKIERAIKEHHDKNPILPEGLESSELLGKLGLANTKTGKTYLELLLEKLKKLEIIDNYHQTWIIKGFEPRFDKRTLEQIQWVEDSIRAFDDEKPVMADVEASALEKGMTKQKLKLYLSYLVKTHKIIFFKNEYVHAEIADKFRMQLLQALMEKPEGINILQYKDAMLCTKRMRALLGEMFNQEQFINFIHGENIETRIEITQKGKDYTARKINK